MPFISGFCLILFNKGTNARMNNNGGKGHPCLVLFRKLKMSDRWPLTHTFTIGLEYSAWMLALIRDGIPIEHNTASI